MAVRWLFWSLLMTQSLLSDIDVLLIDDDEDILESYRHLLNLAGMVARVTDSPEKH